MNRRYAHVVDVLHFVFLEILPENFHVAKKSDMKHEAQKKAVKLMGQRKKEAH